MPEIILDWANDIWESMQLFMNKWNLHLLNFYAKNVKDTHSPANFCFDSIYFKTSAGSSPNTLLIKGGKIVQRFKEGNLEHVVQLAPLSLKYLL